MPSSNDAEYLRKQQYSDGTKLNARVRLHRLYSTNPYGWNQWLFDQITEAAPPDARIVEFGCGPGWLWRSNLDRIPAGWRITLTDFSPGMVEEARRQIGEMNGNFEFQTVDIQSIAFEDGQFDAAIANHMLYHVPDRPKALSEVRRVLKKGATFFAATNGLDHLPELTELMRPFAPDLDIQREFGVDAFSLENGAAQLADTFSDVQLLRYEDGLDVTEAEPIIDYLASTHMKHLLDAESLRQIRQTITNTIEQRGVFHIRKDSGLFRAIRD